MSRNRESWRPLIVILVVMGMAALMVILAVAP